MKGNSFEAFKAFMSGVLWGSLIMIIAFSVSYTVYDLIMHLIECK